MQCEKCHTETEAGAPYSFFYGRQTYQESKTHYETTGTLSKRVTETRTDYKMAGSKSVYLCRTCLLERAAYLAPQQAAMFTVAAFLLALFIIAVCVWLLHTDFSYIVGVSFLVATPFVAAAIWAYKRFDLKNRNIKPVVLLLFLLLATGLIVAGSILISPLISFALGNVLLVALLTGGAFLWLGLPRIRMSRKVKQAIVAQDAAFLEECLEPKIFQEMSILAPDDLGDNMAIELHRVEIVSELGAKAAFFTRAQFKNLKVSPLNP